VTASKRVSPRELFAVGVILVMTIGIRLWVVSAAFSTTIDSATVGVMAQDILKGARPLFYYGQAYMGALEAYLAAPFLACFGTTSTTALAMAPITASVLYLLAAWYAFRMCWSRGAGLLALLAVCVPSWVAFWYMTIPYGGYSLSLALGMSSIALVVAYRCQHLRLWTTCVLLGVTQALAVWTSLMSLPYLAAAWLLAGLTVLEGKVRWRSALLAACGCLCLTGLGLLPYAAVGAWESEATAVASDISLIGMLLQHTRILIHTVIPGFFLWPVWEDGGPMFLDRVLCWSLMAVWFVGGVRVLIMACYSRRWDLLWPYLFCGLFLVSYLLHPMARVGTKRYLIPLSMVVASTSAAACWLTGGKRWRVAAVAWVVIWGTYHAANAFVLAEQRTDKHRERRAHYQKIADEAIDAGLQHVVLLGSKVTGYEGLTYTFFAGGRVRFVSAYRERCYEAAQTADGDSHTGYLFSAKHADRVLKALKACGVKRYEILEDASNPIVYNCEFGERQELALLPDAFELTMGGARQGSSEALVDRRLSTVVTSAFTNSTVIEIALRDTSLVSGIYLSGPSETSTPDSFVLEALNGDGEVCASVDVRGKVPSAYRCGRRLFMMGYASLRDVRFEVPVETARLRMVVEPVSRSGVWSICEVGVFAAAPPLSEDSVRPSGEQEALLSATLRDIAPSRVYADPFISARLLERDSTVPALRHFNPESDPASVGRRCIPVPGVSACVVDRAFESECSALLQSRHEIGLESLAMQGEYALLKLSVDEAYSDKEAFVWMVRTALRP
jgi:hypothetical protein